MKRCPEGKAAAVLEHTLRHWSTFTTTVENHTGIKNSPAGPHIGFLLKYVHFAVMDWQHEVKKLKPGTVKAKAAPPPVQSIALYKDVVPDKKKPPTPEQKAAMFKLLFGD
jgi:hypothetical protein